MTNKYTEEIENVLCPYIPFDNLRQLSQFYFELLDNNLEGFDDLITEPIDFDDYCDWLESWQTSHNKFKRYFRKTKDFDVFFTRESKRLLSILASEIGWISDQKQTEGT